MSINLFSFSWGIFILALLAPVSPFSLSESMTFFAMAAVRRCAKFVSEIVDVLSILEKARLCVRNDISLDKFVVLSRPASFFF